MRVLAFDSAALRMGWACLTDEPGYVASGIKGLAKLEDEKDQDYRLRLIEYWVDELPEMVKLYEPDLIANETLPLVGGGNFSNNVQSKLANTAISALQTMATFMGLPIRQVAAISVKARIGGGRKATKVAVRNGVFHFLPELKARKSDWSKAKAMDEPDAIGIGLTALGFRLEKPR